MIREPAIAFLDRFGDQAAARRWTAADLFGSHPAGGVVPVNPCGALTISGERVRGIESARIRFGVRTHDRDPPGRRVAVPARALKR